jgi:hypothetical protein
MPKAFLYLVQSSADRLPPYRSLADRPASDALFLTWDKPVEGAVFQECCSWGEGRNRLFQLAHERPGYLYYIFIDDDIVFVKGSYARFEELLLQHRPAFACPVFIPKTLYTVLGLGGGLFRPPFRCLQVQLERRGDCQMTALHRTVLEDGLLFPAQTHFDNLGWWTTSSTLQILVTALYGRHSLQFNPIAIINAEHRPYLRSLAYPDQALWLRRQFRTPPDQPADYIVNPLSRDGQKRLLQRLRSPLPGKYRLFTEWIKVLAGSLLYRARDSYGFTPESLSRVLRRDSDLFRQYLQWSPRARPAPGQQTKTS